MTTTPPDRSIDQRMSALAKANEIRSKRAQLKRDMKAGRVRLEEVLIDPPEWLCTAKVYDLLLSLPKTGRVKANKTLTSTRTAHSKTVGGMSTRQRDEILAAMRRDPEAEIESRRRAARRARAYA